MKYECFNTTICFKLCFLWILRLLLVLLYPDKPMHGIQQLSRVVKWAKLQDDGCKFVHSLHELSVPLQGGFSEALQTSARPYKTILSWERSAWERFWGSEQSVKGRPFQIDNIQYVSANRANNKGVLWLVESINGKVPYFLLLGCFLMMILTIILILNDPHMITLTVNDTHDV